MEIVRFKITEDHLKLIEHMYVSWWDCEYGAPGVDPKRPYGNSFVEGDIANILGWRIDENDDSYYREAEKIHREMQTVLQICLCTKSFEVGTYEMKNRYFDRSWFKVQED